MPGQMHNDVEVFVLADQSPSHSKAGVLQSVQSRLPPWLQSRRSQALAGAAVFAVVLLPAIIAPAVIISRQRASNSPGPRNQAQGPRNSLWASGDAPRSPSDVVPETYGPFVRIKDSQVRQRA